MYMSWWMNEEAYMMKKSVLSILYLLFIATCFLSAVESKTIELEADIPEDFGMIFPDVIWLDRFAFEVSFDSGDKDFVRILPLSIGSITEESGSFMFSLLYYGNQGEPYNVQLSLGQTILSDGETTIPLYGEIRKSDDAPSDIEVNDDGLGSAAVFIPPAGTRSGVPVVDVILSWNGIRDANPGRYTADLEIGLTVL